MKRASLATVAVAALALVSTGALGGDAVSAPPAPATAPVPASPASTSAAEPVGPVGAPPPGGDVVRLPLDWKPPKPSPLRDGWLRLDALPNKCKKRELHFDYWPNGGVRTFYCHAISVVTWKALVKMSGVKPFLKGPHSGERLKLNEPRDFGRYNPAFVRWLVDNAIPGAADPTFREQTQRLYEQYVRELARTYFVVHEKLAAKPEWRKQERALYLRTMDEKNPDWGSYYIKHSEFLGDAAGDWGGYDPNLQSAAVAFWLRRDVDGTAPLFLEGLEKLLETYDVAWLDGRASARKAAPKPAPKGPGAVDPSAPAPKR